MKQRKIWIGSILQNVFIFTISTLSFYFIENKLVSFVVTIISFFVIVCLNIILTEIYCKHKEKMRIKKMMESDIGNER